MKTTVRYSIALLCLIACSEVGGTVLAQIPTGTITGHVSDPTSLPVSGVTVTVESPALQGTRTTVTAANGDFVVPLVPPGTYTITFERSGFGTVKRTQDVAATQTLQIDVRLEPAQVTEIVSVFARSEPIANQATAATNFTSSFLSSLPTTRTLLAATGLSPAVHDTGPSGNFTIQGAMSFDNAFMLNGVRIQDNIRGTPFNLFVEDAIQEITVQTQGVSAEFGQFGGGIINAITKSGGNLFSGSYRMTLNNDNWRTVSPYGEPKTDKKIPTHEGTFGGPILKNHLWFFSDGRYVDTTTSSTTSITKLGFQTEDREKRGEIKFTESPMGGHNIQVGYMKNARSQGNNSFGTIMDLASLYTRTLPQDFWSLHYTGALNDDLSLEGQFSSRHFSFVGSGSQFTDLSKGTLMRDRSNGNARFWSPTFCGVCDAEKRDNIEGLVKATYFVPTTNGGSHNMVFGYDTYNDKRFSNNHQSGSDYRIFVTKTVIAADGTITPIVDVGNTSFIEWDPILQGSQGTNFRTHAGFINDNWRVNSRLTLNLGARYDKNHGVDAAGKLVANDSRWSPRVGVVWDPNGAGKWAVTGSVARYVAAISNGIADSTSVGGQAASYQFFYQGPAINTGSTLVPTDQVIKQVFDWFFANGGTGRVAAGQLRGSPSLPGVNTTIVGSLSSPYYREYAVGASRFLGNRGTMRADLVFRDAKDFYADQVNTTTGSVTNSIGQSFDLHHIVNTNVLKRNYKALNTQASYRVGGRVELGGNYTLSDSFGNFDGENVGSGPITSDFLNYPEYRQAKWNIPEGNLKYSDQRHKLRLYTVYTIPANERWGTFSVSGIQIVNSGTPYGAVNAIDPTPYVTNPGYLTPPAGAVDYYFTAPDAFRTKAQKRTDFAFNYSRKVTPGAHHADVFFQAQVLNIFNRFQVFNINNTDTTILTNAQSRLYSAFNPFTTTPVQGVNWDYGTTTAPQNRAVNFGAALNKDAYTLPRTFRMNFGIRF